MRLISFISRALFMKLISFPFLAFFISGLLLIMFQPVTEAQDRPKRLSFQFVDTPLREALLRLSDQYGVSILFQEDGGQDLRISARCDNCTVDEALNRVLKDTPFRAERENCYVIQRKLGSIQGRVIDKDSRESLSGANVFLQYPDFKSTKYGDATDATGAFEISDIQPGKYVLIVSLIAYRSDSLEVDIGLAETNTIDAAITENPIQGEEVVIEIEKSLGASPGIHHISSDMVKLDPLVDSPVAFRPPLAGNASGGGVSNFSIRGGNPYENGYIIDGIPVDNIYHLPSLVSGGAFSSLKPEVIDGITYYAFSPLKYGGKITMTAIDLRAGSSNRLTGHFTLGSDRIGGIFEGPIKNKSTFLLSARRIKPNPSLAQLIRGKSPELIDVLGKLVFTISDKHKFALLNLFGNDHLDLGNASGYARIKSNTVGMSWEWNWGKNNGRSFTSVSHSFYKFNGSLADTSLAGIDFYVRNLYKSAFSLQNMNTFFFNASHRLEFGVNLQATAYNSKYRRFLPDYYEFKLGYSSKKLGAFGNYMLIPHDKIIATLGVRADYYTDHYSYYTVFIIETAKPTFKNRNISSNFSIDYQISELASLNAAAGVSHQSLYPIFIFHDSTKKLIKFPEVQQYSLAFNKSFNHALRLHMEIYHKGYKSLPRPPRNFSTTAPGDLDTHNSFDEPGFSGGYGVDLQDLTFDGKAFVRGIECTLQKNPGNHFWGFIGASYFRAKYQTFDGRRLPRAFDHRFVINLHAGYQPNEAWKFSLNWTSTGGAPSDCGPFAVPCGDDRRFDDAHTLNLHFEHRLRLFGLNAKLYSNFLNVYERERNTLHFWSSVEKVNQEDVILRNPRVVQFGLSVDL